MRLILSLFLALTCVLFPGSPASALEGADAARYFDPDAHIGATHVYRVVSTGSVTVAGPQPHLVTFQLSTEAAVSYGQPEDDGTIPFQITFVQPAAQGLDASVARALEAAQVRGTLRSNGALAGISTPAALQELGLDFGDLIMGLIVPRPDSPQADTWTIRYTRSEQPTAAPRSPTLQASFTAQGLKEWTNRPLSSVTGRLRGDSTLRQGATTIDVQEIGHALYYLDPVTGVTEMSSVSLVATIRSVTRPGSAVETRVSLTTTFERRREREPAFVRSLSVSGEAVPGGEAPGSGETSQAHSGPVLPLEPLPGEPPQPGAPEPARAGTGEGPEGGMRAEAGDGEVSGPEEAGAATGSGIAAEPAVEPEPILPGRLYADPAGRFSFQLPAGWEPAPARISLRGTAFQRDGEAIYVYVMPLPSPDARAAEIARAALDAYERTQGNFTLIAGPWPAELNGQEAYEAFYRYTEPSGATVSEWATFSRRGDRAFYLQYARQGEHPDSPAPAAFRALLASFTFGPTPSGQVDAGLLTQSLEPFEDAEIGYRLLVPVLWPLLDRSDDGSSATFVEIGERGYLTVFAREGARGFNVRDIIASWRSEWQKEPGFRLIRDLYPADLGGRAGVGLEYSWQLEGDGDWTRRLVAAIEGDVLYAVAIDYVSEGFAERAGAFDGILSSFEILERGMGPGAVPPPAEESPMHSQEPAEPPDLPSDGAAVQRPGDFPAFPAEEASQPFREPLDEESVLLLGRARTRYQPAGSEMYLEEWVANATVYVRVGSEQYVGATDAEGYIYVSNLPPLQGAELYEIARIEAPMFGYVQPVAITFQHLETGLIAPRIADLGIVEVTLERDGRLSVDVRRPAGEGAAAHSSLDHFVAAFPASAWARHVREAIALRDGT